MKKVIPYGKAVCYSGYREGQSPKTNAPSVEEITEDLNILVKDGYQYIRMYDPNMHAQRVLHVIRSLHLPLKCILGIDSDPEENNPNCPFEEQHFSEEELTRNRNRNDEEIEKLIVLAKEYEDIIAVASVGNENTPYWTAHKVTEERLIRHVRRLRGEIVQPITFCEGYYEWENLKKLAAELDLISVHTYPYHYGTRIEDAVAQNRSQYEDIQKIYPEHQVIITELGWSTDSTNPGKHLAIIRDKITEITFSPEEPKRPSVENAKRYLAELEEWTEKEQVIAFYFEAFDELWKGKSRHSSECNFGIYDNDRKRK